MMEDSSNDYFIVRTVVLSYGEHDIRSMPECGENAPDWLDG
jgi:hypothetical protein